MSESQRSSSPPGPLQVARVAVDIPLSHLDRPFDYAVRPEQDADAVAGARVRVRFAGRLRDGVILERATETDRDGELLPLHAVVSGEPVLTPETAGLIRAVADHSGGIFSDVFRLAVPPRHAATEKAERPAPAAYPEASSAGPFADYPTGPQFLAALRAGNGPRALWQVTPTAAAAGDWAAGLAAAARACADSGRGAVLVVPDKRDLTRLEAACREQLGPAGFAVLVAEAGPATRYRGFLAAVRGDVRVVIGNRAAAYTPVRDLGLVGLWDDGDDLLIDQRAPYPHTRDVLAIRATRAGAGALFAGYGRSVEVQGWLERGWLVELAQDRPELRHAAPRIRVAADRDDAEDKDVAAKAARLPHDVFEVIRAGLPQGPVLIQVPRAGYLVALVCQDCREPVRCRECSGPCRAGASGTPRCAWCGLAQERWECRICGARRYRAPVVGAERTAEELGKAFPNTPVRQSVGGKVPKLIADTSALVVATPGAEPPAEHGYAAAVLLDTGLLLLRQDLRAAEEALRRWLNAVALVRSGADGGSVIAVGDSSTRPLQALVRLDPGGFAARELVDRADAHLPPAAAVLLVEGAPQALAEFTELARLPPGAEQLGPVPAGPDEDELLRLTVLAPRTERAALARAAKEVAAIRSARKSEGSLRMTMDPAEL